MKIIITSKFRGTAHIGVNGKIYDVAAGQPFDDPAPGFLTALENAGVEYTVQSSEVRRLAASRAFFSTSISPGALIANLINPFDGATVYSTVGTVPGQLALSTDKILAGLTASVDNANYAVKIRAVSQDGLSAVEETLSFQARLPASAGGTPTPTGTDYFSYEGGTYAWNSIAAGPTGFYSASQNKTLVAYQAWNGNDPRLNKVRAYNHATGLWGPSYVAQSNAIIDDDHGQPSIVQDHQGYYHMFNNGHDNRGLYHSSTTAPNDESTWAVRTSPGGSYQLYTYTHPVLVGSQLYLFVRKYVSSDRYYIVMFKTTSLNNGVATWSAEKVICDFGSGLRAYVSHCRLKAGKIYIGLCKAEGGDLWRNDIYFAAMNPAASDTLETYDGSTTGVTAITSANAATFRIYAHSSTSVSGSPPVWAFDSNGDPHFLVMIAATDPVPLGGPGTYSHMKWTGSGWSSLVEVGTVNDRYITAGIYALPGGAIRMMWGEGVGNLGRGADHIVTRDRDAAGNLSAKTTILTQGPTYPVDIAFQVEFAQPDLMFLCGETTGENSVVEGGYGRKLYAYGQNGFVRDASLTPEVLTPMKASFSGHQGVWLDPSDLSTMFSDVAGTTPATVDGLVRRINDKAGNGNNFTEATNPPTLRSAGGLYWLEFNGTSQILTTTNLVITIDKPGTGGNQDNYAGAAIRYDTITGIQAAVTVDRPTVGPRIVNPIGHNAGVARSVAFNTGGTAYIDSAASLVAGTDYTQEATVLSGSVEVYVNGASDGATTIVGTPNYGNSPIRLGASQATTPASYFGGRLYGFVWRADTTSVGDRALYRAWINSKRGV